jgi:hypothetical protein
LDFLALLIFGLGVPPVLGGLFLFYSGHTIPTHFRPTRQNHQKL